MKKHVTVWLAALVLALGGEVVKAEVPARTEVAAREKKKPAPDATRAPAAADPLRRRAILGAGIDATPDGRGVVVNQVLPNTSAASAGLQPGDLILSIDGETVSRVDQLIGRIRARRAGDVVSLAVEREGKPLALKATLTPLPMESHKAFDIQYDSVEVDGARLRSLITRPRAPGKHPAVLLIPGMQCFSVDAPMNPSEFKELLYGFTKRGFVTMRVEKSGMGDSEGKPCSEIDLETEVRGFIRAVEKLKTYDFVAADRVFLFGHTQGGYVAPLVAAKQPVRGVIVYGTPATSWYEFQLENARRQLLLGRMDLKEVDRVMRDIARFNLELYVEKRSPAEILQNHPDFKEEFEDETHRQGRHITFHHQLGDLPIAALWAQVDAPVLALFGASDISASREDHERIAAIVNRVNPGNGTMLELKDIDHYFHYATSRQQSYQGTMTETFNPIVIEESQRWMTGLLKGGSSPG